MLRSGLLVQLILVAGVALGQWPGQEGGKLPWWMDPNIIDFDPKPPRVPEADARSRFPHFRCFLHKMRRAIFGDIKIFTPLCRAINSLHFDMSLITIN